MYNMAWCQKFLWFLAKQLHTLEQCFTLMAYVKNWQECECGLQTMTSTSALRLEPAKALKIEIQLSRDRIICSGLDMTASLDYLRKWFSNPRLYSKSCRVEWNLQEVRRLEKSKNWQSPWWVCGKSSCLCMVSLNVLYLRVKLNL